MVSIETSVNAYPSVCIPWSINSNTLDDIMNWCEDNNVNLKFQGVDMVRQVYFYEMIASAEELFWFRLAFES